MQSLATHRRRQAFDGPNIHASCELKCKVALTWSAGQHADCRPQAVQGPPPLRDRFPPLRDRFDLQMFQGIPWPFQNVKGGLASQGPGLQALRI